jgi:hypothetical protein
MPACLLRGGACASHPQRLQLGERLWQAVLRDQHRRALKARQRVAWVGLRGLRERLQRLGPALELGQGHAQVAAQHGGPRVDGQRSAEMVLCHAVLLLPVVDVAHAKPAGWRWVEVGTHGGDVGAGARGRRGTARVLQPRAGCALLDSRLPCPASRPHQAL